MMVYTALCGTMDGYLLVSFPPLSTLSDRDFVRFAVSDVLETDSSSAFLADGGWTRLT